MLEAERGFEEAVAGEVKLAEVAEGTDGRRHPSGEEVVGDGEGFEVGEVLEEVEVAGEFVGGDVQRAEARERGEFGGDLAGEEVVGEVKEFELAAVNDLGRDAVNELVVGERELFELCEASYCGGQDTVEMLGFQHQPRDSEHVGFLGREPSLAEHTLRVTCLICLQFTVDSEVLSQSQ